MDLAELSDIIHFGASPRATIDMFKAVKANAYLRGNDYVSPIDITLVVKDVLRHRIILTYEAMAQEINVDDVIQKILEKLQFHKYMNQALKKNTHKKQKKQVFSEIIGNNSTTKRKGEGYDFCELKEYEYGEDVKILIG